MKRLFLYAILAGLLFCGCHNPEPSPEAPTATLPQAQTVQTEAPTEQETVPAQTEAATEPETTPVQTEPYDVPIYLVEEIAYTDSRRMQYFYDDALNLIREETWDIENNLLCITYYEDHDANGMPHRARVEWADSEPYYINYTYREDGKLLSVAEEGFEDSGCEYIYNAQGQLIEKRSMYEGEPFEITYLEYTGGVLTKVWRVDQAGEIGFDGVVEDGRILEKYFPDPGYESRLLYRYDERGLLIAREVEEYGEVHPNVIYRYTAEQVVDSRRAAYLRELQNILLDII